MRLLGGGVLLYLGAEWFVGGASTLALVLRIPKLIVGLTVVAYGTSAPEVIVSVQAAKAGHGGVALGNVIGSNIANIGLVLGVAALIAPARVDGALARREVPVLLLSTLALPLLLWDGVLSRAEAGGLLLLAALYTGWMVRTARRGLVVVAESEHDAGVEAEAAVTAGAPAAIGSLRAALTAAAGLGVLLWGGNLFIDGAVSVAQSLGISEKLVGLTIVAVGTSLPELVTSVIAARRGHADLAVGNVIGSNIFNVLLCLGAAGLAGTVAAPLASLGLELLALGLMTVLAVVLVRGERTVSRSEAVLALGLYAGFMLLVIQRG